MKTATTLKTIAYVITDFPVLSETFIGNEIRAMEEKGHRIVPFVFFLRDGPAQPEDRLIAGRAFPVNALDKAPGIRLLPRVFNALPFLMRQSRLPRRSLLWTGLKLAAAMKAEGCSHIHAHFAGGGAAHAIVAGAIAGLPVSFTCHGHDVYAEPEDLEAKLAAATRVVAVCDDLAADLKGIEAATNVVRIACGTNPERFQPSPTGAGGNGRLLFIGRLVAQKGIDDLMEALRLLDKGPAIALDIVGDGPLREEIEREAAAINAKGPHVVRLLGGRDAQWLKENGPAYIAAVLPFKTGPDGSRDTGPLVVKEAMAMSVPVISTAYMGVKETVTPETGTLVPPGNPQALSKAIANMLSMPLTARRAMGAAGRDRVVAEFTLENQARALSSMIEAA